MTPLQNSGNAVLHALEEGQATMLIQVLPILQPDATKIVGLKHMFIATLQQLKWKDEDIYYWVDFFNLTDEEESDTIDT